MGFEKTKITFKILDRNSIEIRKDIIIGPGPITFHVKKKHTPINQTSPYYNITAYWVDIHHSGTPALTTHVMSKSEIDKFIKYRMEHEKKISKFRNRAITRISMQKTR